MSPPAIPLAPQSLVWESVLVPRRASIPQLHPTMTARNSVTTVTRSPHIHQRRRRFQAVLVRTPLQHQTCIPKCMMHAVQRLFPPLPPTICPSMASLLGLTSTCRLPPHRMHLVETNGGRHTSTKNYFRPLPPWTTWPVPPCLDVSPRRTHTPRPADTRTPGGARGPLMLLGPRSLLVTGDHCTVPRTPLPSPTGLKSNTFEVCMNLDLEKSMPVAGILCILSPIVYSAPLCQPTYVLAVGKQSHYSLLHYLDTRMKCRSKSVWVT